MVYEIIPSIIGQEFIPNKSPKQPGALFFIAQVISKGISSSNHLFSGGYVSFRECNPWRIHGTKRIFTYMNNWFLKVNVGKYTSPIDPMGKKNLFQRTNDNSLKNTKNHLILSKNNNWCLQFARQSTYNRRGRFKNYSPEHYMVH